MFEKAVKKKEPLRLALVGPSGAGKTYSALVLATELAEGGKIALLDSEHGSSKKYADIFSYDIFEPDTFSPEIYTSAIEAAVGAGYS